VLVAGDNVFGLAGYGAFEDAVVGGVVFDRFYGNGGGDKFCKIQKLFLRFIDSDRRPIEFIAQYACHFIEDVIRDSKLDFALVCTPEKDFGGATEVES